MTPRKLAALADVHRRVNSSDEEDQKQPGLKKGQKVGFIDQIM